MKKIVVDKTQCISCGLCVGLDSEHFEFDEAGLSDVKSQDNLDTPELAEVLSECPTTAITIEDDDNKKEDEQN